MRKLTVVFGKLSMLPFFLLKFIIHFTNRYYLMSLIFISLFLIEGVSFFSNKQKQPFLIAFDRINTPAYKVLDDFEEEEFYGLDPLLGWCLDPITIRKDSIKENCIYREYFEGSSKDTLKLYISGGSTSDIIIYDFNWPHLLFDSLKAMDYNVIMYVAALSGYTTSQEYLKLIRDNLFMGKIDAHISYFGANEMLWNNSYMSESTIDIFEKIANTNDDIFLPNTMEFIQKSIFKQRDFYLAPIVNQLSNAQQTEKNIRLMNALSRAYNYQFIPILQPGLGFGNFSNGLTAEQNETFKNELWYEFALDYTNLNVDYYKHFESILSSLDFKVYDYTNIFEHENEYPFLDIHHVKKEYQHVIVENVLKTLSERELLPIKKSLEKN